MNKTGIMTYEMETALVNCIHVTTLDGKLAGFYSISTSVLLNKRCAARALVAGSICSHCYAAISVENYDGLKQALDINYFILNNFLISDAAWETMLFPTTNGYGRIESHGDVDSTTCAQNYIRLIRTHKYITFGAWTKNIDYWTNAFNIENKPENMTFIVSSIMIGETITVPETTEKYVDHVFTVYNDVQIKRENININCGARDCNKCRRCYKNNTDYQISEKLKGTKKTGPMLVGSIEWKHNSDGTITLVFIDETNGVITEKTYKTERGAKTAETKFYNKLARF